MNEDVAINETASVPARSPRRSEQLARIAFTQFSEHGFEKVSLDQIAKEAEVTKGALYSHYSSKSDLFAAACQIYYQQWQQNVQKLLVSNHDPLDRIRSLLALSVRRCIMDRKNRVFTTELFAVSLHEPLVQSGWAQFYSMVREQFIALVTDAQETKVLQLGNARRRVDLMLCALEGLKIRSIYEPGIGDGEEMQTITGELLGILGHDAKSDWNFDAGI